MQYRHGFLLSTLRHEEDPFFQSVIYLCEHADQGALGLVINKPLGQSGHKLLASTELAAPLYDYAKIFWGGPVFDQDRGFVLHRHLGQYWKGTSQLASDLYLTTTQDILPELIQIPHDFYKIFLGYVYWQPKQLEYEMSQDHWLWLDYKAEFLFHPEPSQIWAEAYQHLGFLPQQIGCVDPGALLHH